jgi:uncharacterized protein YgbK (DUF1537 family)
MIIGIVADDLTGAADAVAPFARIGWPSGVGYEIKHSYPRFRMEAGDVVAYDTETRDLPADQAQMVYDAVRRAARRLAELRPQMIYKKIDSTLRGHLMVELQAMRQELPGRMAVVCPAYPANGRTVQSGVLHIHGIPWTQTEFAPIYYLADNTVIAAFGAGRDPRAVELPGLALDEGLEAELARLQAAGVHTVYCDANHNRDLATLAAVIARRPERYLPVGSSGLLSALASLAESAAPSASDVIPAFAAGRVLVVVGSMHRASRQQAEALCERYGVPPILLEAREATKHYVGGAVDALAARFRAGERVGLLITPEQPNHDTVQNDTVQNDWAWLTGSVVRRLCERCLREGTPLDGLVITGGKTAIDVCQALNGIGLRIQGEMQPGVVTGMLHADSDPMTGLSFDGLPLITKAGGFGDAMTLARCVGLAS